MTFCCLKQSSNVLSFLARTNTLKSPQLYKKRPIPTLIYLSYPITVLPEANTFTAGPMLKIYLILWGEVIRVGIKKLILHLIYI